LFDLRSDLLDVVYRVIALANNSSLLKSAKFRLLKMGDTYTYRCVCPVCYAYLNLYLRICFASSITCVYRSIVLFITLPGALFS
jgi:hypothetical protein